MTFKILVQYNYGRGPYHLSKIPKGMNKAITTKRFSCPLRAIESLRAIAAKLSPGAYYGAEVVNDDGLKLAVVE